MTLSGQGLGPPQEPALADVAAQPASRVQLDPRLDALGDQGGTCLSSEVAQAGGERLASRVGVDVAHQPYVELHEVGPELGDVAEAGISGAGVVNPETDRSTSLDGPSQGGV